MRSANPPLTSAHMPMWMPGANEPFGDTRVALAQVTRLAPLVRQTGDTPRVTHAVGVSQRVEGDTVPRLEPLRLGSDGDRPGDHLVSMTWGIETESSSSDSGRAARWPGSIQAGVARNTALGL